MKFSFPVPCSRCGETFDVNVTAMPTPKSVQCPKCDLTIWLVEPLGNVVGMAILGRASAELKNGDCTLAIVLGAMAVECELAYLFMKWKGVDLMSSRMPTDADEEEWEREWREDARTVAARLDRVSSLLTGQPFDSFLSQRGELLQALHTRYPVSQNSPSPKEFFVKELFHKRNKIVHSGKIDYQQADAQMCYTLAATLTQILAAMDVHRRHELEISILNRRRGPVSPAL